MKLAVSHIAWTPEEDAAAYELLRAEGVQAIEVAPPRWWPEPQTAAPGNAPALQAAKAAGLEVVAFQALLFGRPDLALFGAEESRAALLAHLVQTAEWAAAAGAGPMVFGSPKNRTVPPDLSADRAQESAAAFFRELASRIEAHGAILCLEPNPAAYGCNFLTHAEEVAALVRAVDSPAIRMQIDAGELAMNDENVEQVVDSFCDLIGHVHISQAMLNSFDEPWPGHARLAAALQSAGYAKVVSIEMKRQESGLAAVRAAIDFARQVYLR